MELHIIMIQISKIILLLAFAIYANEIKPWWPKKCGDVDTSIILSDTIIVKYKCKNNGQKVLLTKRNGEYHGLYVSWYSNGNIVEKFNYFKNEFDGIMNAWDSTGTLLTKRNYIKGIPVGFHKDYYSKNKPEKFIHYNSSGKKHGLCETWRKDGTRKDSVVYSKGNIVESKQYFKTGSIRYITKYKGSTIIKAIYYSPTGEIIGKIVNGNGIVSIYGEDGISSSKFEYKNGQWLD